MKVKIEEHEIDFIPFDVKLTLESAQEARLLWHVFNAVNLKDLLLNTHDFRMYIVDIATNLNTNACDADSLEKFLNDKGYSIKK